MLGYQRPRHLALLKERGEEVARLVGPDVVAATPRDVHPAEEEREELIRRLMVRHFARGRDAESQDLARALLDYVACCDPSDLREMDVLHNLYEALRPRGHDALAPAWSRYGRLLHVHVGRLEAGSLREYRASAGEPVPIAASGAPLRVLVLADSFLSAGRIWQAVVGSGCVVGPRLLFCDNSPRRSPAYLPRLVASLARLVARGGVRTAVSMLCSRPRLSTRPLVHASNTDWLRRNAFDVGLHGMGVIYKRETIGCFRLGILNAHIGHLPGMRGRSVLEWSLVLGIDPCVSTFFIDEGIDTGALIVHRFAPARETVYSAASIDDAKRRLFELDGTCYASALATLVRGGTGIRNTSAGHRFYVMSRLLRSSIQAQDDGARHPQRLRGYCVPGGVK